MCCEANASLETIQLESVEDLDMMWKHTATIDIKDNERLLGNIRWKKHKGINC